MSDLEALIAAIHAAPEDDAPRLVFADWLDEHGQSERAEFIRIQVAMRRESEAHGRTDRLEGLFVRSREVFYRPWAEHVRDAFGRGVGLYSRGFPQHRESVRLTAAEAVSRLPSLGSWLGPHATVTILDAGGRLKDIAGIWGLRFVRNLCVRESDGDAEPVTDADVADLVASPHLARLRALRLGGHRLGDAAARAIAGARSLRGVESLNLDDNRIGRAGALALAAASALASLRHLSLANNRLGDTSVKALARSRYLARLESLNVRGNPYTRRVVKLIEERFPGPAEEGIPL